MDSLEMISIKTHTKLELNLLICADVDVGFEWIGSVGVSKSRLRNKTFAMSTVTAQSKLLDAHGLNPDNGNFRLADAPKCPAADTHNVDHLAHLR